MIKKIFFFTILVLFVSCGKSGKFSVSGSMANADGQTLYFEKTGLLKDSLIDSVKLNKTGTFKFGAAKPKYPELYRLRVNDRQLILGIDSTETVQIQGDADNLTSASIVGSKQSEDIQKLRRSALELQQQFNALKNGKNGTVTKTAIDSFQTNLDKHKKIAQELILVNPGSMAAYFGLFQQIDGTYIFSPYLKEDRPYFQAVATTFHTFMPEYERSKNLYGLVMAALKEDRMTRGKEVWENLARAGSSGFIEIELKNVNGYPIKLSSLIGNPILLDFSAYGVATSVDYTFALREIYNKYSPKGLQIYQVSLDESKVLWERSVSNIPWTCVYDPKGESAKFYNVQEIPTMYLIDKQGNIIGRYENVKSVEANIGKVL